MATDLWLGDVEKEALLAQYPHCFSAFSSKLRK